MRRTFTLSAAGLGLFLIGLGIAYFSDLTVQTGYLTTVLRFYPILPILLGLDYLLSALPGTGDRIDRPAGWVATLIILLTIGGLVFGSLSKLMDPPFTTLRNFHFGSDQWWSDPVSIRTIQKNFQLAEGITTVRIENDLGNVEINATEDKTLAATAELKIHGWMMRRRNNRLAQEFDLSGERQGERYLIRLQKPQTFINRGRTGVAANISLTLPKGLSAEIVSAAGKVKVGAVDGNLKIESSAGKIEVERVRGNLEARSSLGAIEVGSVFGSARIKASAGKIEVAQIRGAAEVESSLGEVVLLDCAGPVRAKVDKGRLKVNLAGVPSDCDFEVSMGSAEIGITRRANFSLAAETSMGSIESDFPVAINKEMAEARANGPVNGGGPLVRIEASMGSIQVRGI